MRIGNWIDEDDRPLLSPTMEGEILDERIEESSECSTWNNGKKAKNDPYGTTRRKPRMFHVEMGLAGNDLLETMVKRSGMFHVEHGRKAGMFNVKQCKKARNVPRGTTGECQECSTWNK